MKRIFGEALDLAPDAREAFVRSRCAGDEALRARVEELLAAHEEEPGFLGSPTAHTNGSGPNVGERPGDVIGPYKLLQVIGEGGFGVVYMAEQDRPLRRRVALKVIKLGMDTRAVIARFEAERQALALMDHPNIAHVLDAGATTAGRPYFVMELVRGDPITTYCDRNTLTIDDRLDLFVQLCRAVQHAHIKGVIHRDIKPSNILVSTQDGKPHAKVIDFGIAKATSARLTEKTLFTEFRQFIGTPEYMSPEQAEGSLDIDTRTDVYSLGVLLYELLTGGTPFDPRRLRSAAYDEVRRIIREDEPPRPSTRLSDSTGTLPSVAAHRRTVPTRLGSIVRGDLDWIVMKCLEKDRARRYETAEALAADLERHLRGQAVLAAPPSAAYRVRKFVRRHRGPVAAASAVGMAVVLGAGLAVAGYVSAVRARDAEKEQTRQAEIARTAAQQSEADAIRSAEQAKQEAAKARAVNDFFQELLRGVNPENARANRGVTVRELLDKSASGLDAGRLRDQPEIEAVVRGTLGELYRALGDPEEARRHTVRAIELGEAGVLTLGELANLRNELGQNFRDLGDVDLAETAYLRALDDARADGQERTLTIAALFNNLGGVAIRRGQLDKAEELLTEAKDILLGLGVGERRRALQINWNLAVLAAERGDLERAEALIQEVSDKGEAEFSEDDPLPAGALRNLAVTIANQRRYQEAVPIAQRSVDAFRRIVGDTHPDTIHALSTMGNIAYAGGYYAIAAGAHREVLAFQRARADPAYDLRADLNSLANDLEPDGRAAEAEPLRREALDIARAAGDASSLSGVLANLGYNLILQQRWVDAEAPLRESLEIREALYPPTHPRYWQLLNVRSMLGEALAGQAEGAGDTPRARELFAQAEVLIVPTAESLPTNAGIPSMLPGQTDLAGNPMARAARMYRAWGAIADDPTLDAKGAAWQEKYDAYQVARQADWPEPLPVPVK